MADNKFDEFLRSRFTKYSSPVPEDMWQRIQEKKKKDRLLFFILWFLAICLTFFLGYYLIFHSNKNTVSNTSISETKLNIKSPDTSAKIIMNPGTSRVSVGANDSLHLNQIKKKASNQFENEPNKDFYKNKNYKKSHKIIFTDNSFKNIESGVGYDLSNNNPKDEIHTTNKEQQDTSSIRRTIKPSLQKDSLPQKKLDSSTTRNKKENKISAHKNRNWSLEVYASPDIPYFERTNDNTNINNTGKSTPTSYTIGIRVGKNLGKHFSIKTGFQYSQISEKFLDSIAIVDHYRSIDIPFLVGYDLNNKYFNTTINAGIIYNIYSWYEGQTLLDSRGLIDLNVANIYKHTTGGSLYLGINFSKKINDKIELVAEPYFRYRLSYMTKSSAPFNQKINIAGINIGLRYNFKR